MRRAILFANGIVPDLDAVRKILRDDDFCIAVDGGAQYALALGKKPEMLIGDLDSIAPNIKDALQAMGTRIIAHPVDKDETDLALAVCVAKEEGFHELTIVGALGGRLDHTLGNLAMLMQSKANGVEIRLNDGREEVVMVTEHVVIEGAPKDLVSLIPWGVEAKGVRTKGLKFALTLESLYPNQTRGVSNRMLESTAEVWLTEGRLLCVHTRQ